MLAEQLSFAECYTRISQKEHIINYDSYLKASYNLFCSIKTNAQQDISVMLEQRLVIAGVQMTNQ